MATTQTSDVSRRFISTNFSGVPRVFRRLGLFLCGVGLVLTLESTPAKAQFLDCSCLQTQAVLFTGSCTGVIPDLCLVVTNCWIPSVGSTGYTCAQLPPAFSPVTGSTPITFTLTDLPSLNTYSCNVTYNVGVTTNRFTLICPTNQFPACNPPIGDSMGRRLDKCSTVLHKQRHDSRPVLCHQLAYDHGTLDRSGLWRRGFLHRICHVWRHRCHQLSLPRHHLPDQYHRPNVLSPSARRGLHQCFLSAASREQHLPRRHHQSGLHSAIRFAFPRRHEHRHLHCSRQSRQQYQLHVRHHRAWRH